MRTVAEVNAAMDAEGLERGSMAWISRKLALLDAMSTDDRAAYDADVQAVIAAKSAAGKRSNLPRERFMTQTTSRYADDSDVIDIIEAAKAEWFAAHPACDTPTDERTDEAINKSLGLPPSGSLRGLALDLADETPDEIAGGVKDGLDKWYGVVDTRAVEHYDALDSAARAEYRANTLVGDARDGDCISIATAEQLDAIDAGRKAPCLA